MLPRASGRGASHTPTQDAAFLVVCLISERSSVQRGRRSCPEQPQPSALVPGDRSLWGHHEGRLGSPLVQQKRGPRPHPRRLEPLGLAQRKRASPRGEAGTSGFLLCWPREVQSSIQLVRESCGLLSSHFRAKSPHLGLGLGCSVPLQGQQGYRGRPKGRPERS